MKRLHLAIASVCALVVVSCGDPPPVPSLLSHKETKAERVLLDDSLDAADVRQIFSALNENGQLDGLAPWIESTSNEQLNALGDILTRHVYQTAQDSDGLMAVLSGRIARRAFSAARKASQEFSRKENAKDLGHLFEMALKSPRLVDIVERDIGFLSPELDASLDDLHEEYQKAFGTFEAKQCDLGIDPVSSKQTVDDFRRFLATPGLKERFGNLADSITNASPVVDILQAIHKINAAHGGKAFEGMGEGIAKMIREPREEGSAATQFDALMDLVLALEGPSDGLFQSIQDKLVAGPDLVHEMGTLFQPNVPGRVTPYVPLLPNMVTSFLLTRLEAVPGPLSIDGWKALATPSKDAGQKAFFEFFKAARDAHALLVGKAREPGERDAVEFNRPLLLNSYALATWVQHMVEQNLPAIQALPAKATVSDLLALKIKTDDFSYTMTEATPGATPDEFVITFSKAKLDELRKFGIDPELIAFLERTGPQAGMGAYDYEVPGFEGVVLRDAFRQAMLAIDETRAYADGSAMVRWVANMLIAKNGTDPSILESLENDDMLLFAHRILPSIPAGIWKSGRSLISMPTGDSESGWSERIKKLVLNLLGSSSDKIRTRVTKVFDSVGVLAELGSRSAKGPSTLDTYRELVLRTGPNEWSTLENALLFTADSKLFSLKMDAKGTVSPLYPTAHGWISGDNASGILRLISQIQPSRHRPMADFIYDVLSLRNGTKGGEVHWDFFQELAEGSPQGLTAFLEAYKGGSLSDARATLSLEERTWIVAFVRDGSFRRFWEVASPHLMKANPGKWVNDLRNFAQDGTLAATFKLLGLFKNDRIRAIGKVLQEWERTGELLAFLDSLEEFLGRPSLARSP